jgi:glycogen phosphorylase
MSSLWALHDVSPPINGQPCFSHDRDRLKKILLNPYRPVQIIFSGKAHPADEPGKFVMQQVFQACASPEFGGRMAFVEDYEERIAHFLVHER